MLLEMKKITKSFGVVEALKGVNLSVDYGEIHGLLGENGAGKSTLMNILAGIFPASSGEILFEKNKLEYKTSKCAQNIGIRFVHQELNVINDLTVYENLFLGEELVNKFGFSDKKAMIKNCKEVLEKLEIDIDPLTMVDTLETSRKQLLEIAKALNFKAKLIIMDEPTTALNNKEIKRLFNIMEKLRDQGVSIIYISHKMPELFSICDKYTVFRDGRFIESGNFNDIDERRATQLLVGRDIQNVNIQKNNNCSEELLKINNLTCKGKFENISFVLKKGEVIAITGLHGDGRDFLAEALFGVEKIDDGKVIIKGKEVSFSNIKKTINNGISMVQRNRKERSILKDLSILDNFSITRLATLKNNFFVNYKNEKQRFGVNKNSMSIKIEKDNDYITSLSGGNQQKVMIARCLDLDTEIIILDNPTQGIDVGAKFEIYKIINDLSEKGKGIILFSSELPEIYKVADKCIVMYKGQINGILERNNFDEIKIMEFATGANKEKIANG
ncbi:MAG: sugar ABC transporter ATP-binding protein [Fusobacteriaceae bacterium]